MRYTKYFIQQQTNRDRDIKRICAFSHRNSHERLTKIAVRQARARREFTEQIVKSEVLAAFQRVEAVNRSLNTLQTGVLPLAETNIKTFRAVYELGEIKITDLIAALAFQSRRRNKIIMSSNLRNKEPELVEEDAEIIEASEPLETGDAVEPRKPRKLSSWAITGIIIAIIGISGMASRRNLPRFGAAQFRAREKSGKPRRRIAGES